MRIEEIRISKASNKSPVFQHTSSDFYVLSKRYIKEKGVRRYIRNIGEPWYKKVLNDADAFFQNSFEMLKYKILMHL